MVKNPDICLDWPGFLLHDNYKNNACYYRQLAAKTPTYYYHFDHLGSVSLADFLIDKLTILKKLLGYHSTNGVGVCHADEIFYLFKYVLVHTG